MFPKDSEEWQDKVDANDPDAWYHQFRKGSRSGPPVFAPGLCCAKECTGLWVLATLEKVEWKDYLDKGFNAGEDDDP